MGRRAKYKNNSKILKCQHENNLKWIILCIHSHTKMLTEHSVTEYCRHSGHWNKQDTVFKERTSKICTKTLSEWRNRILTKVRNVFYVFSLLKVEASCFQKIHLLLLFIPLIYLLSILYKSKTILGPWEQSN